MDACLRFGVLGPIEITRDGHPVTLGSFKQRSALAVLLADRNHVVSTDRLINDLWDDDGHDHDHQNALWAHISNLRKALEPEVDDRTAGVLMTSAPGYVLRVEDEAVDAAVFEHRVAEGRALLDIDPAAAAVLLAEALAMWRGQPLEDFTYESWAQPEIARLEELRMDAVELRIEAELRTGRRRELVGELESLVRQHPTRESLTASLMLALHGAGRQADALRQYRSLQSRLAEELGIRPSTRLQRLHDQVASNDPAIDHQSEGSAVGDAGPIVRGYEIRDRIGDRGSGVVYRAFQPALGREVAVKIVRPELADDPGFIRGFEAEAQLVARLEHPNIVPVYDFWREPGLAYIVMRLVGGSSLRDLLDGGRALAPDALVRLVDQIGAALETAHRSGVHHGNVSSDHVLVDERGDMYLADFEIAASPCPADDVRGFANVIVQAAAGGAGSVVDGLDGLDPRLATVVQDALTATTESGPDIASLRRELSAILHGPERPVAMAITENPYRGLRSFEQGDADDFFGRDRFVERLVVRLGRDGVAGSFVAVVGPSGSGKSSVVKAGLLPALRAGAVAGSDGWFVVEMTPGVHPFEELEEALLAVAVNPPPSLLEMLAGEHGIQRAVARVVPNEGEAQLVLLVDQFEELFALTPPNVAERFMDALTDATEAAPHRIKVVITLRADFFDRPLRHPGIGGLLRTGTELLTPMTPGELERAISGPAERVGARCEPELVSELIAAMADQPSALPLLEYTLTELFDLRSDGDVLRGVTYRELGGLSGALVDRAEALFNDLDADQREAAEQTFLRLVTLDGAHTTRRRVTLSELRSMVGVGRRIPGIVETFVRHRLLTLDRDPVSRATTVEISHETLLTSWPRLARWLDEARADLVAERRLAQLADEWIERGRSTDFVLGAGRFARYASWSEHAPVALTPEEHDFLAASVAAADERERSRRRQQDRDSRLRRRSALLVGLAVITASVIGLAAFAVVQQRRASDLTDQIAASAEARRLGADAQVLAGSEPGLAMIAALESAMATARYGEVIPASMDALYAVLGSARIQYPFADAQAAVRPASGGGVLMMLPNDLIALVQQHVPSEISDARCRDLGLVDCGVASESFPDDLQIAGGVAAYAGEPSDKPLAGTTVSLITPQSGDELVALQANFDAFTEATGIRVSARANRADELSADQIHGETTADLIVLPQPGALADAAQDGPMDLTVYVDRSDLQSAWGPYLTSLVSVDDDGGWPSARGPVYGIWNKLDVKSLLWKDPGHFDAAGFADPTTWDETIELSDRIVDAGHSPWCMGIASSGLDDGWPASDVLEAVVLRQHGPEVYDAWWTHQIPFDDRRIIESAQTMAELVFTPGYLFRGPAVAARTTWVEGPFALAEDPPGCWLISQPSFVALLGPEQLAPLDFPIIDPEFASARVGSGTFVVAMTDRPEVRAVVEFMATAEFGEATVEPATGFIPPHTGVDLESIADEDERTMAKLAHDSLVVDQFRFDASDMMPREIGTVLMWGAMVEWFDQGPDELERIFAEVEDAWVALESGQDGF